MMTLDNFTFATRGIKGAIDTVNKLSTLRDNLLRLQAELADATENAYTGRLRLEYATERTQAAFENLEAVITRVIKDNKQTADEYTTYLAKAVFSVDAKEGVDNEA